MYPHFASVRIISESRADVHWISSSLCSVWTCPAPASYPQVHQHDHECSNAVITSHSFRLIRTLNHHTARRNNVPSTCCALSDLLLALGVLASNEAAVVKVSPAARVMSDGVPVRANLLTLRKHNCTEEQLKD